MIKILIGAVLLAVAIQFWLARRSEKDKPPSMADQLKAERNELMNQKDLEKVLDVKDEVLDQKEVNQNKKHTLNQKEKDHGTSSSE